MKRAFVIVLAVLFLIPLVSCKDTSEVSETAGDAVSDDGRLKVYTTVFVAYDFATRICGELANVQWLLAPGIDPHSYQPGGTTMALLGQADLVVVTGGRMDSWAEQVVSMTPADIQLFKMSDYGARLEYRDQTSGAAEDHSHNHDHDHDHDASAPASQNINGHVWTSPKNCAEIVEYLCRCISTLDPDNANTYRKNADEFKKELLALHEEYKKTVDEGNVHVLAFSDGCAFDYMVGEYVLPYHSVLAYCGRDRKANDTAVAIVSSEINKAGIPVIFYDELSDQKNADSICEKTKAKKLLLHGCHTVTQQQFDDGVTYLDLMRQNLENLRQAVN